MLKGNTVTPSIIRIASDDHVGMVTSDVRPGMEIGSGDLRLEVKDAIPFGHKIALMSVAAGEKIMKFGVPIGRATTAIQPGEHVHVHNIESDYINNAVDHYDL
jgi:altronate hydrolase